jgi:hypothetical protein
MFSATVSIVPNPSFEGLTSVGSRQGRFPRLSPAERHYLDTVRCGLAHVEHGSTKNDLVRWNATVRYGCALWAAPVDLWEVLECG